MWLPMIAIFVTVTGTVRVGTFVDEHQPYWSISQFHLAC